LQSIADTSGEEPEGPDPARNGESSIRAKLDDIEAQAVISALTSNYRPILGSPSSPGPDDVGLVDRDILIALPIETITGRSSGSLFHISTRPGRL
jgi:hypothetical protein